MFRIWWLSLWEQPVKYAKSAYRSNLDWSGKKIFRCDIIFLQPVTMLKHKDDAKAIIRFYMQVNTPYLATTYNSKIFFIRTILLKALRHQLLKHLVNWKFLFMQTLVCTECTWAHICHNLILSYGVFDIGVQRWNFYCSYLHMFDTQKHLFLTLQLSLVLEKNLKWVWIFS